MPETPAKMFDSGSSKPNHGSLLSDRETAPDGSLWQFRWTILILVLATVLRLAATLGDLAIDEVWSLGFVRYRVHSIAEIFALRHDNNHLLNTFILYVLGPNAWGICYRIAAAVVSILAVWLSGRIASRRYGSTTQLITQVLVGAAYLLILYGSEARGYSYAIFFAYLSWLLLLRVHEHARWIDVAAFAISACLGFLAHLTFLYCFAGFCVWAFLKWLKRPNWILPLTLTPPFFVACCLYLFFIRGMQIGGGPETTIASAVISTLSIISGGPLHDDAALITAFVVLILLGIGFVQLWKSDHEMAACYATIIVLAPASVLFMTGHQLIYPRYFLIPVAFALLLIGNVLAILWNSRGTRRMISACLIAVFLAGNGWWTILLLNHGRGDYSHAMSWMAQDSKALATVSSDHDFRNGLMFAYFSTRLWPTDPPLQYVDQRSVSPQGTDWVIRHNFEGEPPHPKFITDSFGNGYRLERTFRHQSLSGWNWWIYRRNTNSL
jgi:hypothetical protein